MSDARKDGTKPQGLRLSDMLDPDKLKHWLNSLSPEMRRFYGLPSKKRGRKKDLDIPTR